MLLYMLSRLFASQDVVPYTRAAKVHVEVGVRATLAHEAVVLNLSADHTGMRAGTHWR